MRNLFKASLLLATFGTGLIAQEANAFGFKPRKPAVAAPELNAGAGGAAAVVLLGAAAIIAARRQKRA